MLFTSSHSPLPPQDWARQGTSNPFIPKSNGLKTLQVPTRSLWFCTGVKETL